MMLTRKNGSSMKSMFCVGGRSAGLSISCDLAVGLADPVLDAGSRGDESEVELALQPLLDDLHVQQAEEAAAEAEAERARRLRRVADRRVVELQLLEALAEGLEVVAVDREQAAEHHRLRIVVAVERLGCAVRERRDRLAAAGLADGLDAGDEIADLARARARAPGVGTGRRTPISIASCGVPACMNISFEPSVSRPFITRTELTTPRYWSYWLSKISACSGASGSPFGAGIRSHTASSRSVDALAGLRRDPQDVFGRDAEHGLDLHRIAIGVGGRQVDLVERGDDLEVVLHRQVAVGQRLGLDALGGVDHQHHALARGQAAADLVSEVDVAGRVDEVQGVALPIDTHVLGLDRDPPLALQVHRVEVLRAHVAGIDGVGDLQNAVAERALAVIDVGNDREVANA